MKLNHVFFYGIFSVIYVGVRMLAADTPSVFPPGSMPAIPFRAPASLTNLDWDSDMKATNAMAGDSEAKFAFNFTNESTNNVTFLNVHTSCGCTTAQLPTLPWLVAPGVSGQIGVTVNIAGKSGVLFKTVTVGSNRGLKTLTVKITILQAVIPSMSVADRAHNVIIAQADRQAVFSGDCAVCHVISGDGKYGKELYEAVCGVCHEGEHRATMVPDLHTIIQPTNAEFWRNWIEHGKPGTLMPAFSNREGGPLSDLKIDTLVRYLSETVPSK
jgi:mono/diheme cytochrome c family protein